ncbi:neuropeptide-like 3 [Venturia canescens]|uniref:neuropeptide-like 3 n=1 Tax=Venturia canescens TaxID=32260 RepID=UPI001C9C2B32|nr:neuropeptide-like 3 [Venturia canescens]
MFKLCVFLALVALAFAAPAPEPAPGFVAAYAAPVLSSSSQYINRNYNALAAAPLAYAAAPLAYGAAVPAYPYAAHYAPLYL